MRVGVGGRADGLVGNVHAPDRRNPTAHRFTAVDGLTPTRVERCPDANLLEHTERGGRGNGSPPERVRFTGVVEGEGGGTRGTAGTGATEQLGEGVDMHLVVLEVRVARARGNVDCASRSIFLSRNSG